MISRACLTASLVFSSVAFGSAAEAKTMVLTCFMEKIVDIKPPAEIVTDRKGRVLAFKFDSAIVEAAIEGNQDKSVLATILIHDPTNLLEGRALGMFKSASPPAAFGIAAGDPLVRSIILAVGARAEGDTRYPATLTYVDEEFKKAAKKDSLAALKANMLHGGCALRENDPQDLTFYGVTLLPPIVERK